MTDDATSVLLSKIAIQELVQENALVLDNEDLSRWLEMFDESLEYRLSAYSSELRREVVWWQSDRLALEKLVKEIPQHVRDPARRCHLVCPSQVNVTGEVAFATSRFAIFRTLPEGDTHFYVAGRYEDSFVNKSERWLYRSHHVVVETRQLDAFTHLPL